MVEDTVSTCELNKQFGKQFGRYYAGAGNGSRLFPMVFSNVRHFDVQLYTMTYSKYPYY